jgi:hypothetical protein
MLEHVTRTVRGVVTNGQKLMLSDSLPLSRDVGTIDMDSTPRGAKVYLKDKLLTTATPEQVRLEQGTYTLTARYKENEGWPPTELTVEVKKGTVVPVNFYFKNGRVIVESDPPEANVWIGTNLVGTTPVTVTRPEGKTAFHFERAGFEPTNETVLVADKALARVKPSLLSNNGEFDFTTDPAIVTAHILDSAGKELGRTGAGSPLKLNLAPGQYSFLARVDGLSDVPATLQIQKREIKNHTFVFDCGTVRLESVPPGATISIDRKLIGVTPKTFVQKPGATVSYQVASPNYIPAASDVTLRSHEYDKSVVLPLSPEPVRVALASDPPGAEFLTESGVALKPNGEYYSLPWGQTNLVARHGRLGARTNAFDIQPGKINKFDPFKFIYGTLMLTNLEGFTVKEGTEEVQDATRPIAAAYEPPGVHTYDLYDGGQKIESLKTNIAMGLITILHPATVGEWRNSVGMRLVKVRNLIGPGQDAWVGKSEVTQKDYKTVMATNPSGHQLGDEYPVENVTWLQATEFCKKLTDGETKPPPGPRGQYLLPTGEQWSKFASGAELKSAVYGATNLAPVGSKGPANVYGLYDVLGNVREWLAGSDPKNKDLVGGGFRTRPSFGGMGAFTNALQVQLDQAFDDLGFRVIWVPIR